MTPATVAHACTRKPRQTTNHRPSSLVYLNNRYHDPTLGSFISVDPLVTTTGEAYIYGGANPVTFWDPTGLCPASFADEFGSVLCFEYDQAEREGHLNTWGGWLVDDPPPEPQVIASPASKISDSGGGGLFGIVGSVLSTTLDVGRATANAPRTIPAVLVAEATGGDCGVTSNLGVECVDVPGWVLPDAAITFGDAVLTDRSRLKPELAAHENSHRWQQALFPLPIFEIAYTESQIVSVPLDLLRGCKLGSHNPFEILSAGEAGYGC